MILELAVVGMLWAFLALQDFRWFAATWLLGWGLGLLICQLQGYFEHRAGTTSNYGRFYNTLFFNDGFHVEHHARPGTHWTELPSRSAKGAGTVSNFPAVLRWLEVRPLDALERFVLISPLLQRFVVNSHARAFSKVLHGDLSGIRRATIVGGGLFPRTAIVLQRIAPHIELTIVDRSPVNIELARNFLGSHVRFVADEYQPAHCADSDIVVFPLAFDGDKVAIYTNPPAPLVLVHDWAWRGGPGRAGGAVISLLLLKRLNILRG